MKLPKIFMNIVKKMFGSLSDKEKEGGSDDKVAASYVR